MDEGVEVVVPPLHDEIVTATVKGSLEPALREAQRTLAEALDAVDARYDAAPSGISISVGWGLPYFRRLVPEPARERLPVDLRASEAADEPVLAIVDALRFPSDPEDVILEENDVAFFFRSDRQNLIGEANEAIFEATSDIFELTSIRRGRRRRLRRRTSLPKRMALAAGVPGAGAHPRDGRALPWLHLDAEGRARPTRDRELRDAAGLHGSMAGRVLPRWHGHARLAHLRRRRGVVPELRLRRARLDHVHRGMEVDEGTQTVPQEASDAVGTRANTTDARRHGAVGHSAVMQPTSVSRPTSSGATASAIPRGRRCPSARTSTRSTTRSFGAPTRRATAKRRAGGGSPLRRLHADERRLPPHPPRHGRCLSGRHEASRSTHARAARVQLDPAHDAPAELPRAAPPPPLLLPRLGEARS